MRLLIVVSLSFAACFGGGDDDEPNVPDAGTGIDSGNGNGSGESRRTVSERCTLVAETLCDRLYGCLSPEGREAAGLPGTEAACVTAIEAEVGCARASEKTFCEGNERYHADQHELCIEQIETASCGQLTTDTKNPAPACGRICSVE